MQLVLWVGTVILAALIMLFGFAHHYSSMASRVNASVELPRVRRRVA